MNRQSTTTFGTAQAAAGEPPDMECVPAVRRGGVFSTPRCSIRQTKTLQHFFIITGFYLLNLLVAYAIKTGYLNWNIWVIDFFFLFTVSAILGIWGFRQRESHYASILSADPMGVYFILSMALVSFATIGYLFATANDTAVIVLRDVIMYSHLGYGIIFLA